MKVVMLDRPALYVLVKSCFEALSIRPRIAEVGVLRGDNAERLLSTLDPSAMYLVDAWSPHAMAEFRKTNSHRDWVHSSDRFVAYFGGPLNEQSTFDRLYEQVHSRFAADDRVHLIRDTSDGGCKSLRDRLQPTPVLDYVYVDASHQYETVLDDLLMYGQLVAPNGLMQLNDCCHSEDGVRQNLGVLEAATKFCKMTDFVPAMLTNTNWSDLVLVRRGSAMMHTIDQVVLRADVLYVELPAALLPAATVRSGTRDNLAFC